MTAERLVTLTLDGAERGVFRVPSGQLIKDVCDELDIPIPFSCRDGVCGTCAIRVVAGMENLTPMTACEEVTLPDVVDGIDGHRLACQARIEGDVEAVVLST